MEVSDHRASAIPFEFHNSLTQNYRDTEFIGGTPSKAVLS